LPVIQDFCQECLKTGNNTRMVKTKRRRFSRIVYNDGNGEKVLFRLDEDGHLRPGSGLSKRFTETLVRPPCSKSHRRKTVAVETIPREMKDWLDSLGETSLLDLDFDLEFDFDGCMNWFEEVGKEEGFGRQESPPPSMGTSFEPQAGKGADH
jgi:hypothetical protein